MHYLAKTIKRITTITKWGAIITIFSMMLLISFTVISRGIFNLPIVGDYELVQLMMIVLVGLGFGYSERIDAHIKVGLLVDRFKQKTQATIDIIVYILVAFICFLVGTILFKAGLQGLSSFKVTTSILSIPHYPFQFLLSIGFYMWGLEAMLKIIYRSVELINGKEYQDQDEGSDINVG
ncbi:TRAP transporter small permease subunit [Alkalihalobacillus sp. BA299]|uniref:TRAP transporter small permease subunit n=1 Tax=Alkalihalobacillus sp. BA299 TaxID=2815938 RepID=UPI001ADA322C|nr:TRAP transporter small permease [Alkalihalobacillus sp. BA299]